MPPATSVAELLARARREVLSDVEREELDDDDANAPISAPLNPRNEAAALSALYAPTRLPQVVVVGGDSAAAARRDELDRLAASYVRRTGGRTPEATTSVVAEEEPGVDEATAALAAWALQQQPPEEQGGDPSPSPPCAAVAPAVFVSPPGSGRHPPPRRRWRGLVATRDLSPGEVALALPLAPPQPRALAITYASARSSDFGRALAALGLDDESLALLFTMVDRRDPDSPHAPFWRALPQDWLGTPLGDGIGDAAVELALGETPLGARCAAVRSHLAQALASLGPAIAALLGAYAQHLQPEWFARGSFLWAAELWYAYAMQLALPDRAAAGGAAGDSKPVPALVPLASLANHAAWPHAVAYSDCRGESSSVDAGLQRVRVFRPVRKGEELTISYGPLANDELLLFYGFSLDQEGGGNPFDRRAVRRQLAEAAAAEAGGGGGGKTKGQIRKQWRAAHEAALARVEEVLADPARGDCDWNERERAFFGQARVFLRGFLAAEASSL